MRVVSATLSTKFFRVAAVVLLVSATHAAHAQVAQLSNAIEHIDSKIGNVVINHIGTTDGMLLFEVKVDNTSGEKFRVSVKDEDGTTLFQGAYEDKNFAKKFMIPTPEGNKLTFVVRTASSVKSQTFQINSSTHVVEDVVVTRL